MCKRESNAEKANLTLEYSFQFKVFRFFFPASFTFFWSYTAFLFLTCCAVVRCTPFNLCTISTTTISTTTSSITPAPPNIPFIWPRQLVTLLKNAQCVDGFSGSGGGGWGKYQNPSSKYQRKEKIEKAYISQGNPTMKYLIMV